MFGIEDEGRGVSGGVVMVLLSSCVSWYVNDLQLDPVGIKEEHCVVPQRVRIFLWPTFDLRTLGRQPFGSFVHRAARCCLEREVVQPDLVTVEWLAARGLRLAQADRAA